MQSHFSPIKIKVVQAFSVLDRQDNAGDAPLRHSVQEMTRQIGLLFLHLSE